MTGDSYLTPEELAALKETFLAQTRELLDELGRHVLDLEGSKSPEERLRAIERIVHTIKGDSMALEFSELSKLAHDLEDFLRNLRGRHKLERDEIDLLLASGDRMQSLLSAYCAEPQGEIELVADLSQRLKELATHGGDDAADSNKKTYELRIDFSSDCQMRSAGAFLLRKRLEKHARIISMSPHPESLDIESAATWTLAITSDTSPAGLRKAAKVPGVTGRVSLRRSQVRKPSPGTASKPDSGASSETDGSGGAPGRVQVGAPASELLRVEVGKIDRIMNLVGELVIGRSMVAQSLSELNDDGNAGHARGRLSEANSFLERTLTELQAAVLKIRMVPVEHVFRRFPRVVRDLAHSRGKKAEVELQGGLTELDKSIVDALGEPLLHLVRNAIDHGLETPEDRERSGKRPMGRLTLSAFYEGNHVHIVVEDDGRGIDVAQVGRRAVSLGILDRSQLDSMTPAEILNVIYHPGFSIREAVSEVSGRGIGMDVVRESIENLKGVIELETAPGRGTRFLIRLPLTLAILRAVLVEVAGKAFAVPLTSVMEIVRLQPQQSRSILGRGVLHWRDHVVPLVSLRQTLGYGESQGPSHEKSAFVLLVGEAERRIGLVAERLLGEQELVVKPIEDVLTRSPGVAGASILGNGRVVLILHTRGLLDRQVSSTRKVEVLR